MEIRALHDGMPFSHTPPLGTCDVHTTETWIHVCWWCRGEVVEDVESPLPSSTPLLLVKPPAGLATPAVFRALDLDARSTADPQQLLAGAAALPPPTPHTIPTQPHPHARVCWPSMANLSLTSADSRACPRQGQRRLLGILECTPRFKRHAERLQASKQAVGSTEHAARAGLQDRGALPELCVNDLEQAAFDVLPSLLQLKERLRDESEGCFTTVFMTGMLTSVAPCMQCSVLFSVIAVPSCFSAAWSSLAV